MKRKKINKYNLHVRLTPSLARGLKRMALLNEMTLTTFVRAALFKAVDDKARNG